MSPRVTRAESIRHARRFHDDGLEIRHLLQRAQFKHISVWECFYEFAVQSLVDARGIDDVERSRCQRKSSRLDAATDNYLGFICESLLRLV